jgi:hypothetical protein
MEKLSRKMEQEQIIMLIITVVTLIYLPATFVSVRTPLFPINAPYILLTRADFFQHGYH